MKRNHWQNRIKNAALAFAVLLGAGIASSATAQYQYPNDRNAQDRNDQNWDRYGNYGGSVELRRTALTSGYNEGRRESSNNQRNNRNSNYQMSSAYRRATSGYSSYLGDRELYRRYFREAFANGYNSNGNGQGNFGRDDRFENRDRNNGNNSNQTRRGRNWDGYGNFGGSFQLRETALNAGYNEGIKQGRNDRNRRNHSDYQNQNAFRKATSDYSSKLGDRETYRRYYREAYASGYDDGSTGN